MVAVLREVKYLEIREKEEVPNSASSIYSKNDTFRKFVANLDLTVQWYNKVSEIFPFGRITYSLLFKCKQILRTATLRLM